MARAPRRFGRIATIVLIAAAVPLTASPEDARGADEGTAADPAAVEAIAASCGGCHAGPLALAGRPPVAVAESIRTILAGARPHPPLPDLHPAQVDALAERLTAP